MDRQEQGRKNEEPGNSEQVQRSPGGERVYEALHYSHQIHNV